MADENMLLAKANANTKEEVNIKDLPSAASLSGSDAVILVQNSAYTKQTNLDDISTYMLKENSIPSLTTNRKDVVDAINELKEDVDILKNAGSGLNQIRMNLQFADISEGGN